MKINKSLSLLAAALASTSLLQAADITGKITLKGTPPPEKEMFALSDPNCGKLHTTAPKTRFYVVDSSGGLADVFVYLKDAKGTGSVPSDSVILDQVGCEYTPYVFGIQTKQKLVVKNSDPVLHNVHITPSPSSGNKESNQAQIAKGPDIIKAFDNPEVLLRFKCDVHPWMFAYAGVLEHPYFAVTGKDGSFKIANVPPGKYTLVAYHRKTHAASPPVTQEVTVGGENVKTDLTVELK
ncbi:MAG: hypothetical protein AB1813_01860 [Verrucomicrobiota bacterium]|jgi:hypothetical protein